ncbi:hypothetical protein QVD17_32202 [Tagetes erecta]|uniref:Uncharacterized protein n=1 Tax=Tagetes erecta TaxID=13708 RepID=A0AAD8K8F0_TARER|nr:hypothetical protein QVD17_32202 [Tagetes erecta]
MEDDLPPWLSSFSSYSACPSKPYPWPKHEALSANWLPIVIHRCNTIYPGVEAEAVVAEVDMLDDRVDVGHQVQVVARRDVVERINLESACVAVN